MSISYRKSWQEQMEIFNEIKSDALSLYENLKSQSSEHSDFFHQEWDFINSMIAKDLFPVPNDDFLMIKHVGGTMFVDAWDNWFTTQLNYLRERMNHKTMVYCMYEDFAGGAHSKYRLVDGIATSHNSIHHMYHIEKYQEESGKSLDDAKTILEWGGGYGNLAKIISRMSGSKTYVLVDSPTILTLQWLYLCSVFGKDPVNIMTIDNPEIVENKFNLLPTSCIDLIDNVDIDMFISTWALSESAQKAKEFVVDKSFFGAENILIALHHDVSKFTGSDTLVDAVKSLGGNIHNIECMPDGHSYLIR